MKKLLTIDDIMVAIIAALGYGFGDAIGRVSGWSDIMCIVACLVVGIIMQGIITKIVFSKTVQKSLTNRIITYVAILLILVGAQYFSVRWMGISMMLYVEQQFLYVVGMPIIGFFVNLLIRAYKSYKIRKRYGDGSDGYVFDIKDKVLEETNRQNQAITGKYNEKYAVKTRTGVYVGEKYKKSVCYMGIPYAKPPVGDLRWKAPEPLPASDAVFEAKNFGASAIQIEHKGSITKNHRQSEDCLTLNIGVPEQKAKAPMPVFVLFHQGDFTSGGSVDPLMYGGDYVIAHPDVIFISFNYRLGIFGFIDFSEVPGGEARPDTLNLGLLDQIAALKWIRENIAAFGGDPDQITVIGFESGASSISLLAACEQAKGLFKRAFVFNGSPSSAYDTPDAARTLAKDLLRETHTSTMQELLQLDTDTLKDAAQRLWQDMCAPTCDGKLLPLDVYQAYRNGAASGIEFVYGIPANISQVFRSLLGGEKFMDGIFSAVAEMQNYMDKATADAVNAYIEAETAASSELDAKSKIVEQWIALSIYRAAAWLAESGNPVHLLYWAEKPLIENLGSGTADAAASLLGNGEALQMYGGMMNTGLSRTLQTLLHKFIKGESLQLYRNELPGVDAVDWDAFPNALIVSDGKLQCDTIEDRVTEVRGLLEFVVS
ncbi:MAG: carboxylesterase family protein [Clostridia bacterium]|nr:carboxylesterase family protein [Clostridia bacterium]